MIHAQAEHLHPGQNGTARSAELLSAGKLVAFPTETVYGLGADARSDHAVAQIFEAKGRPNFNPLIVHLPDTDAVRAYVQWSDTAQCVADAFWPGPLTMVLPMRDGAGISKLVTAGLNSLAVRVPAAPIAQELLRAFKGPIAAPSANRSGQISPSTAAHVLDGLGARIAAVLDGGPCAVGLESTILGLRGRPTLLRPGGITEDALETLLDQRLAERRDTEAISAPGQLSSHYAPRARVRLNATEWQEGDARLGFADVHCDLNLSASGDLVEAAANLFAHLHALDALGREWIAVSPIPHVGLGVAINDRLNRAAAER